MINSFLKFFLAFCWLTIGASALQQKQLECQPYPYSRVAFKHREHKGVGWDKGYTTLSLFLAPRNNHVLVPFLDTRFHAFNNGYIASNLGVGARFAPISDNFVVGFNTYYDFREYKSFSSHQASGGIEFLTSAFDFRLNGYYPFSGKTEEKDVYFHQFRKNSAYLRQDILYSLPSADAEIGFELPEPMKQVQLYLAFGSYYLFKTLGNNHSIGNAIGYKARLTATPEDYISFGVEYTHDRLFNSRVNGYISFQVPLGKKQAKTKSKHKYYKHRKECDSYYTGMRRKTQDPYHNEIIPFYDEIHTFNADRVTNSPNHFIFVNNTNLAPQEIGSGSGTFEDPYTTLKLGELNSAPGDIIYVFYGRGNDDGYNKGFVFKNNQTLAGSGTDLEIKGFYIPAYTPGQNPLVSNNFLTTSPTIQSLGSNNILLQGLNLSSKNNTTVNLENCSATVQYNLISTSSTAFNCITHQDPFSSSIVSNIFNGKVLINGIDHQAERYLVANNQFQVKQNVGLELINSGQTLLVANNFFTSLDINATAIGFKRNDVFDSNEPFTIIYRGNYFSGFSKDIDHIFNCPQAELTSVFNNTSVNNQYRAYFYFSISQAGTLRIAENIINNSETGMNLNFAEMSNISCFIQKNDCTNLKNSAFILNANSTGGLIFENNKIKASSALNIENLDPNENVYSFAVTNNDISFVDVGVKIDTLQNGSCYGKIENNTFRGSGQGISLETATSTGNICCSIINNKGTNNPSIFAQSGGSPPINIKINPPLDAPSLINQNPGFRPFVYANQVTFTFSTAPCAADKGFIYVDNTNTNPNPDGSKNNPYPTLQDAQGASAENDTIVVAVGDGTTKGYDQGITLKNGQTLISLAALEDMGRLGPFEQPNNLPTITKGNGEVVTAANDCTIKGLNIFPQVDTDGIRIPEGVESVTISNNTFFISGNGSSVAAIKFSCPKLSVIDNTLKLNDNSNGILQIASLSGDVDVELHNNTVTSNSPSGFFLRMDVSSSNHPCTFVCSGNNLGTTQKAYSVSGSTAANSLDITENLFDSRANSPQIICKGPYSLNLSSNFFIPSGAEDATDLTIFNGSASVINDLSKNNLSLSPDLGGIIAFGMSDRLCFKNISNNSSGNPPSDNTRGALVLESTVPVKPLAVFAQSLDDITKNNVEFVLVWDGSIQESTPCQ